MTNTLAATLKLRRDTAANWTSANPVLAQGEPGFEVDTGKLKVGDGTTVWVSLPYISSGAGGAVSSVFGRTGAVVAQTGDYTPSEVGADPSGSAATAQSNAESFATTAAGTAQSTAETFATNAVATETTRAETAEALKAPLASPALTGSPTAPTQTTGDNTTKIATDAFVATAVAVETTRAEGVEGTNATAISTETTRAEAAEALLAPKASPALTGTPTAPTASPGTNTTQLATTAFVESAVSSGTAGVASFDGRTGIVVPTTGDYTVGEVTGAAPLASPALTGTPTAPTATALTDNTQVATTAYADSAVGVETTRAEAAEALKAPLASPALTGTPTAPTKSALTNNTDIATTAYADAAVGVETSRAETAEAAAALKSNNLSDLASASTARTNLGLGTAATQASSAFDASGAAATAQSTAETFATSAVATETSRAETAEALLAPKASPALTGTPTAPTATALTDNTQVATTAYADTAVGVEKTRAEAAEALLVPLTEVGAANGVASLDSSGLVPVAQLPIASTALFLMANLSGSAPSSGVGLNGDYIIDVSNGAVWGPKASGTWPGSAGATLVEVGGALGTPSSGTLTNATGLPLSTGVTGTLSVAHGGSGVATITGLVKGNGTSAMTAAAAGTDFVAPGGALGTPSSGTLTNATGLPLTTGVTGQLPVANGGTGAATLTGLVKGNGTGAFTAAASGTDYVNRQVISTSAPGATPSINTGTANQFQQTVVEFTGLAANITSMTTNLTGSPQPGDTLRIAFTDNGTARTIAWGTGFEGDGLPTTTLANTRLDVSLYFNPVTGKFRCVGSTAPIILVADMATSNVTVGATSTAIFATLPTLSIGTWRVEVSLNVSGIATPSDVTEFQLSGGTATYTEIMGPSGTPKTGRMRSSTSTANENNEMVTFSAHVIVTVAGTVQVAGIGTASGSVVAANPSVFSSGSASTVTFTLVG